MTKSIIIEYNEQDENVLFDFLKKIRARINSPKTAERRWVQKELTKKYVQTGLWATMSDDDRQDATLAEMMAFQRQQPDYEVLSVQESRQFLANLKQSLHGTSIEQTVQ
jgi:hypothetical protein